MKRLSHATLVAVLLACEVIGANYSEAAQDELSSLVGMVETTVLASDGDEEKLTIKKVMKLAHKSGLLKKVATAKATDEEIAELQKYYDAMPKLSPPRGEKESWKKKTDALVEAAKAAVEKDPNAAALLKSATECAVCHDVHK